MAKKRKPRKDREPELPALVNPKLTRALSHVVRQHILLAAREGEVSPNQEAKSLGLGVSQISYHFNVLGEECGLITVTRTVQRRGAVQHYYRATAKGLLPAKSWRPLKKALRAVVGAGQASELFDDLAKALKADKLNRADDQIVRTPLVLDREGQRKVKAIAERAVKQVEREQQASARRVSKARAKGGAGKTVAQIFALLHFEAAGQPAHPKPEN